MHLIHSNTYLSPMKIDLLYEDEAIIIANKPANLLIHHSYYARNIREQTLLQLLKEQQGQDFYPIHRLDRKTSGLMVLAKQKNSIAEFQHLFEYQGITKHYVAIVRGHVNEKLHITSPVKLPENKVYKDAETQCIPLDTGTLPIAVGPYEESRYSLVLLIPKTGRIHQLRIHMNKVSRPIIGDTKYGDRFHNRMFEKQFGCGDLLLHAQALRFVHPLTSKLIELQTKMPPRWQPILDALDWHEKTVFKK